MTFAEAMAALLDDDDHAWKMSRVQDVSRRSVVGLERKPDYAGGGMELFGMLGATDVRATDWEVDRIPF